MRRSPVTTHVGAALRALTIASCIMGAAVAFLLPIDALNSTTAPADPGIAAVDPGKHSRLLILHLDSWRDRAATDSTLFPTVQRLRRQGASGTLLGVYEGFTIPAVRAAFTGHAETQLVNVVRNFRQRALPIASFFRDVQTLGKRTLIVAQDPFVQFGAVYEERMPPEDGRDMYALDRERPGLALQGYRREPFDVVVCQWESFDWIAHEDGVATARYRTAAHQADSVIALFAAARAPQDYLLVYGDHGHTEAGEHKTGYDIPSHFLLLGPDVTAGAQLPPLAITDLRYVASHALGIRLHGDRYDVATLRQALPIAPAQQAVESDVGQVAPFSRRPGEYLVAAAMLLLAVGIATVCWRLLPSPALDARAVGTALICSALLFASTIMLPPLNEPLRPIGLPVVILLYAVGVGAKLLLLRDGGRMRWVWAVAATTALALVEFRVVEHPGVLLGASGLACVAWRWARDEGMRRLALLALLQLLLYFTLRLPIYLYPWIDLFLLAAAVGSAHAVATRHPVLRDIALVTGAWTLACGTLAGNLEWGFLYSLFPAYLVELEVQWFLPFIVAKIPLLLLLTLVAARRPPDRALLQVAMCVTALRFATVWGMRLSGASMAAIWPIAEQGAYLTTFVAAIVAWGWHERTRRA